MTADTGDVSAIPRGARLALPPALAQLAPEAERLGLPRLSSGKPDRRACALLLGDPPST